MTSRRFVLTLGALAAATLLWSGLADNLHAEDRFITVASTTSTQDSGLYDHILPIFTAETGIEVRVVAKGTGQAIKIAEAGDADVLLVHAKAAEEKFVADGYGVERFPLMYNDFVIVGPSRDPAGVGGTSDAPAALAKIAETQSPFASRADDSGTHKAEMRLWEMSGVDPTGASGAWYAETGSGMGATLNTAAAMEAYALVDRATWLSFGNRGNLEILVQGDRRLFNQYGVILANPEKFPHVKAEDSQTFIDWLLGDEGQKAIADFKIGGEQLFFPNANHPGA